MNTDHTLEEVGQQFSVTRERIRQIEAKALRKLKHPSRSRASCAASWITKRRRDRSRRSDKKNGRARPGHFLLGLATDEGGPARRRHVGWVRRSRNPPSQPRRITPSANPPYGLRAVEASRQMRRISESPVAQVKRRCARLLAVIARSAATKQSIFMLPAGLLRCARNDGERCRPD
ncbi:MAG: hypothetical protein MZV49_26670 [Rhodopseudomonas palustris]|nr:hypothetical protein [Rhodopseudomonas palustris]